MSVIGNSSAHNNINPTTEIKTKSPAKEVTVKDTAVKISSDSAKIVTKSDNTIPKDVIALIEADKKERTLKNIKNGAVMIGIMAGAGTMLGTRSVKGAFIGMGIMGVSAVVSQGTSGGVAFGGSAASIGAGALTGYLLMKSGAGKNVSALAGGLVAGAGIYLTTKASKALE